MRRTGSPGKLKVGSKAESPLQAKNRSDTAYMNLEAMASTHKPQEYTGKLQTRRRIHVASNTTFVIQQTKPQTSIGTTSAIYCRESHDMACTYLTVALTYGHRDDGISPVGALPHGCRRERLFFDASRDIPPKMHFSCSWPIESCIDFSSCETSVHEGDAFDLV